LRILFAARCHLLALKGGDIVRRITFGIAAWLVAITWAHFAFNVNWAVLMNDRLPESARKLNLAYIPVT